MLEYQESKIVQGSPQGHINYPQIETDPDFSQDAPETLPFPSASQSLLGMNHILGGALEPTEFLGSSLRHSLF